MSHKNNCDDDQAIGAGGANVGMREQSNPISSNLNREDDDGECWDDAKALLNDDIHQPATDTKSGNDDSKQVDYMTTKLEALQPISSAAYSSAHSNDDGSLASQLESQSRFTSDPAELALHEAIFKNDIDKINVILDDMKFIKRSNLVDKQDKHGNTALHLACMLGRSKEIVAKLLRKETKWTTDIKNLDRWTPFHEACSYGDREILKLLCHQLKDTVDETMQVNRARLQEFLTNTKNFRLVLKWEFQSWVPLISRYLPSDICIITKHDNNLRVDTGLLNIETLFWRKGMRDTFLLYSEGKWIVVNTKKKGYQFFETVHLDQNIEEKIDGFMAMDIMDVEVKKSDMELTRSTYGWIWKSDKLGKVGPYNAALYEFTNVQLIFRKRREHLSDKDLKRNKLAYKAFTYAFGTGKEPDIKKLESEISTDDNNPSSDGPNLTEADNDRQEGDEEPDEVRHRESLPPPPPTSVTWEEYIQAEPGQYPTLGRPIKCKTITKPVRASVALSEEFPLTKHEFLDLLSGVPLKSFQKVKEFVEMKLPDGFPVRIDIPLFPFLSARITFEDFYFNEEPINESLFTIPTDFKLDNTLLPESWTGARGSDTT